MLGEKLKKSGNNEEELPDLLSFNSPMKKTSFD